MSLAVSRRQFLAASTLMLAGCMVGGPRGMRGPSGLTLDAAGFGTARRFVATRPGLVACVDVGSGPGALYIASPLTVAASAAAGEVVEYADGMFAPRE